MLPRDLKVASLNLRDIAKRLTVKADSARTLPLSYMQYYVIVHNAAVVGRGRGSTSTSM
jgi:hypothetical protein